MMSMVGIGVLLAVVLVLLLWAGALYVLSAVAMAKMARKRSFPNPWLAWVPGANTWLLGSLADHYDQVRGEKDRGFRWILVGFLIAQAALGSISGVAQGVTQSNAVIVVAALAQAVLVIVHTIFQYMVFYRIYKSCTPDHAVWMLILSILSPTAGVIIMLCIRDKTEGIEEYITAESSAEGEKV